MAREAFKRKLTAILSADAVGYSRLMEEDEEATVRTLTSCIELITAIIEKHQGRVVDAPGDNILAEFSSVVDALRSAWDIQQEIKTKNAVEPENRRMHFRIGINLGDVIEDEARIFGDGVNIAARLEGLADEGGICISGTVYDQVKKKLPYRYDFRGEQTVKNIQEPIRVYLVLMDSDDKNASDGASPGVDVKWDEIKHLTPLRTKLCVPPPRSSWIKRSRLVKRMDEGFGRKLTLISAPAGFGKTTLLVDWVHTQKIPVAWFSIDKGDNDPLHFLTYVILGLQSLEAGTGKAALTMLQSPQPPPIEAILINLLNDVSRISTDLALVLDDYHLVDARPIHDLIAFLLENLPEQMHLIIATRSDPPLPLARVRSQNLLIELRAADLSFSADETASLFNQSLNLQLSRRDIQLLETRTEGWAAGLQLAALSLQGRKEPTDFIKGFKGDNRYIADYLTEEVLSRQPEHLRNFLLQTSILGRLCGPLCDAVIDQENSRQVLNNLEKANLFVIPLDDERCWYRYHQLFADLLAQRLRTQQGDRVPELHRRASQWFAKNGFKNEAVDHAFFAQDYDRAVQLIEEIAEIDWDRARESRLLRWFKKLPDEKIDANPKLCIFYARELFKSGYLDDAEKRLHAAEQMLESISSGNLNKKGLLGRIAVIRAYISFRTGDPSGTITFSSQALKLLPQEDLNWRSVAATTLGLGYGMDDMVKSQEAFSEAMKICKAAGNLYYHIFAGSLLASGMFRCGRLEAAKDMSRQLLNLAIENGIEQTGIGGSLYLNLGSILCEWNDLDEGIRLLNKGIEMSELGRDPVMLASCQLGLLRAFMYRMDLAGAVKLMENINERAGNFELPPWITNTISALKVFFWLGSGNLDAALQWAQKRGLRIDDKLDALHEVEYIALAHVLMAQNKLDEADRLLGRLIENATAGDRVYMIIEMRLWRVLIFTLKADSASALAELKLTLALAEPGGFIMMFVSKGKPVADLLEEIVAVKKRDHDATQAGFSLSYAKKILSAYKAATPPKIEGLLDPISERELEVLHLIAAGLSNKEIAEKLFISLNTVKTHTKNINSKLDVNSRIKAVARAKELGLL
jgi:LuxR family maltose regulon positive regulatory protein